MRRCTSAAVAVPRAGLPGSKMEAAGRAGQEMSLAALRRHDPFITGIADVTGQVALYSFSPKDNEWVSPAGRARLCPRPGSRLGPARPHGPARGCVCPGEVWGLGASLELVSEKGRSGGEEARGKGEKEEEVEEKGEEEERKKKRKRRGETVCALGEAAQFPLGPGLY